MKLINLLSLLMLLTAAFVSTAQVKSSAPASAPRQVVATSDGAGSVKLLISMDKIPAKFPGLYDRMEKRANSQEGSVSDAEHELVFYQNGVEVMKAYANSGTGIYGGIRCIFIPEGSPLKVKVAPKQYISTGDPASEVWTKTGKKQLGDGISACAPYYSNCYPLVATYVDDGGDGKIVVFYVERDKFTTDPAQFGGNDISGSIIKPGADIKGILIFYWVNEFM